MNTTGKAKKFLLISVLLIVLVGMFFYQRRHARIERSAPSQTVPVAGTILHKSIDVAGKTRTYVLAIPDSASNPDIKSPLLLMFHGGKGSGENIMKGLDVDEYGNARGYIVAFPDGMNHHWNDGRSTTYSADADDIQFVRDIVKDISASYSIDTNRIYAAGVSNGGIFAQRLSCETADMFAAVASDIGPIASELVPACNPSRPLPFVAIQGVNDPLMPIAGGEVGGVRSLGEGGLVESADASMKLHAEKNSCQSGPTISDIPPTVDDGTRVQKYEFSQCENEADVIYYIVQGMGHVWPPNRSQGGERISGNTSQNINATEVFFDFFEQHVARR